MISLIQLLNAGIIRSLKARYRRKLVRWLLDAMHAGVNRILNVLEAVQLAIANWGKVTAKAGGRLWSRVGCERGRILAELMTEMHDVIERVGFDADQEGDNDSEPKARYNHQRLLLAMSSLQSS
ncbi:DDE superfamily endonuclease, CENP-B-like [Plasmopara halstedii]|uniref:DDE superfamily endonuclease, CENP-B-like n=1 Tax=Plasmopara halstedii TaxID=4781 RepID=A0A0P1AFQ0_PLAHL|nr:DDE superfamily endonuclease, CENP-B-like [Plasmopara halstedii]CEG39424.1 DDE superfamily endonuclease, CENP-B-like [Plasmopara halstedii]|eukprot:XP_024575793.1 DDE superfamily endonuclease, CENP-B-like [Plasmopara halstedii]